MCGMNGATPPVNAGERFVTEKVPVGWPWRLLMFSVVLFALAFFLYFGIKLGYGAYLDREAASVDRALETLGTQVTAEDQDRFLNFYSQIVNLKGVLDRHSFTANAFSFLERNVIDAAYFTDAEFLAGDLSLELKGAATSFDALSQQMAVFEKVAGVDHVLLSDVTIRGGGVNFTLSVFFKESFFKRPAT